jgi:DNA ligase (NAD+)
MITQNELENLIKLHQDLYYNDKASGNGNEKAITDSEFDALWDMLKAEYPDSALLKKVGKDDTDGFPKTKHIMMMGSQEKAANEAEFLAWYKKYTSEDAGEKKLVQYKLDGASLELQYKDGVLEKAVTRGDGIIGDEITGNALKMRGVKQKLSTAFSGGIRGEVLMFHDVWRQKYQDKANCRNAANGLMRRKEGEGSEDLTFICYDALASGGELFSTEIEKIEFLEKLGLTTVPAKILNGAEEIIKYREHIMNIRESLDYDIDGLVVKNIDIDIEDMKRVRPQKQIAFKFDLEEAVTILRDVEWSENGATYTPIGLIDSVRLAGTIVKRASLNNPDQIRKLNLKIGNRVRVVKRGEIIPKIIGLALDNDDNITKENTDLKEIEFPTVCSTCNSELVNDGTRLYCPNTDCKKRLLHRLEKWVSVLDIRELGLKLLTQLFDSGRVQNISDLYTLEENELSTLNRMGELSASKVLRNIKTPRTISLAMFVAGFDIEGVQTSTLEKITDAGFNTLEKLRNAAPQDMADIYMIGEVTADAIHNGLVESKTQMDKLLSFDIIKLEAPQNKEHLALHGISFCFTGELKSMKRMEAEAKVKALGGSAKSSVVKDLSYLVNNDRESTTGKNKKAIELGIRIINEEEFLRLLAEGSTRGDTGGGPL